MNLITESIMEAINWINTKTFGLELKEPSDNRTLNSVEIENENGAIEVYTTEGGIVSTHAEMYTLPTNEAELIKTYRNLAQQSDVDRAITEIKNEVFTFNVPDKKAIDIDFNIKTDEHKKKFSKKTLDKIVDEYDYIYNLLNFKKNGIDLFTKWYVDGRLHIHIVVDSKSIKDGIQKLIYIDSLKIKKIVEYPTLNQNGVYAVNDNKVYYIYSDAVDVYSKTAFAGTNLRSRVIKLTGDSIAYSDSGIYDSETKEPISYLWKSIIPYNNMKMMEDALIIYRVVRSSERRVFYIGTGNLSPKKSDEYIRNLMSRFKNKLVYNQKTGTLADKKHLMSMVEDYWIPRRDDGKGTQIETLPGGSQMNQIDDVILFKTKFLESLNVPKSRFSDQEQGFIFGRSAEISRDEYRFRKFLDRLRDRFVVIFEELLKTQLILKNIITNDDWEDVKSILNWVYCEDNYFVEWKETELFNSRIETLTAADPFLGKYFDKKYIMKTVMKFSDEVCEEMQKRADEEMKKLLERSKAEMMIQNQDQFTLNANQYDNQDNASNNDGSNNDGSNNKSNNKSNNNSNDSEEETQESNKENSFF